MRIAPLHRISSYTVALALVAGAAFSPQAAAAGSIQDHGAFGGTWTEIAPSDHYDWRYTGGHRFSAPIYAVPGFAFGPTVYDPDFFGPPVYGDDEPDVALVAPDVGVALDID
jgi:hypothetical protein